MSTSHSLLNDVSITKWLLNEVKLVRGEIREGRFQRSMAILTAFASIVSGFEAYMQHQRGAFSNRLMWSPVLLTVPTFATAGLVLLKARVARTFLRLISLASLADGIVGFAYHLRGIQRLPGGFKLGQYNIVMGPPIFAPLLLCSVGILGLFASYLRPERLDRLRGEAKPDVCAELGPTRGLSPRLRHRGLTEEVESRIAHGQFQRWMALASAFLVILSGGEVYFEHLRGSFNQRWMWLPVWITAPMAGISLAAVRSKRIAQGLLSVISGATLLVGLVGFLLHLRGIWRMPGGIENLRFDVTLGPPLFAPLLFTASGLLGLIAAVLRRKE